jgi:hypothetical protein
MKLLTMQEIATVWDCNPVTVRRAVVRFGIRPCGVKKRKPLFSEEQAAALKQLRDQDVLKSLGYDIAQKIITVKQAKAGARKRGGR